MSALEAYKVTDRVYWVGAIDDSIRDFHGYSTSRGTTYNAYLILGKAPVLIDTVKEPFFNEMMSRISSLIDPKEIAYIISNHAEMDHSGCLPRVIEAIHPEKVFASKMGVQALHAHFHFNYELTELNHQEKLQLGEAHFTFLETKMLHWPDSMFTYFSNDGVLFSQDAFGMHVATRKLFSEENDSQVMQYESAKYFANILLPYSDFVSNLFKALPQFDLDIRVVAPDHGPVWHKKEEIDWVMKLWSRWAKQEVKEKVVIVYDTMWGSTDKMARAIAEGVIAQGVEVKVMPLSGFHRSDVATELLEAGALLVGSPTINQQMFPTVSDVLCYLKGLKRRNLIGQVFGSYGWGAHAIKLIQSELQSMNVRLVEEAIKVKYVPDDGILSSCRMLGEKVAEELKCGK